MKITTILLIIFAYLLLTGKLQSLIASLSGEIAPLGTLQKQPKPKVSQE